MSIQLGHRVASRPFFGERVKVRLKSENLAVAGVLANTVGSKAATIGIAPYVGKWLAPLALLPAEYSWLGFLAGLGVITGGTAMAVKGTQPRGLKDPQ